MVHTPTPAIVSSRFLAMLEPVRMDRSSEGPGPVERAIPDWVRVCGLEGGGGWGRRDVPIAMDHRAPVMLEVQVFALSATG